MKNPFGDDFPAPRQHSPFPEDPDGDDGDPAATILHASARIRRLKAQVGSDGLTPSATRELIDHLSHALDAAARAIRKQG
jgi:hypothetical protein